MKSQTLKAETNVVAIVNKIIATHYYEKKAAARDREPGIKSESERGRDWSDGAKTNAIRIIETWDALSGNTLRRIRFYRKLVALLRRSSI